MRKQRGIALIAYGVIALVGLVALSGIAWKIRESGKDAIRVEWAEADRKAEAEAAERRAAANRTAKRSAEELAALQQKGRDYEAKWRKARSRAPDSTLAGCPGIPPRGSAEGVGATPAAPARDGPVRFSGRFVGLWDGAWTGAAGEPVFPDRAPPEGAAADPVGPGELLDNHAENAARCSTDRRALDALIGQVERLRAGWK